MEVIRQFSSATGILASARHLSGNKEYYPDPGKESEPVLTRGADSSLVVDRLCDQTGGRNTPVTCFYFDFAARKDQTATSMLGSLLKQMISGMERGSGGNITGLAGEEEGGLWTQTTTQDIVKMLQLITSSLRTFMIIGALDECTAVQRFRLFDLLKGILVKCSDA